MTLDQLKIGQKARVLEIEGESIKRRLLEIGLIQGVMTECVLESPFHEPKAYFIKGATIAIRKEDARKVLVEVV